MQYDMIPRKMIGFQTNSSRMNVSSPVKLKVRSVPSYSSTGADTHPPAGKGIVVFTGCSHAGVVNTTKNALALIGNDVPLHAVVGGFHLAMSDDAQVQSTVADLKRLDPAVLMPGHCSGWRAKFAIEKHMPGTLVPCTVGIKITF